MKLVDCQEESDVVSFNDKVMGVFDRRDDLNRFLASAEVLGAKEAEVLAGARGEHCLQQVKHSVEGFLDAVLGDMESAMLKVYLQAVERGAVVFAIPATSENRDAIVTAAVRHGAKNLAHFGQLVTESFEYLTGDAPA